jgi:hypothetical protein
MANISLQSYSPASIGPLADRRVSYVGHGRLESSPETLSPLHVIEHEMGHVQEFRGAAARSNSEVRDIRVKINYELRDGRMVAVSGETSATTQKRPESKSKDLNLEPYSDGKSFKDLYLNSQNDEKKDEKEMKINPAKISEHEIKEDLESKIKELSVKLESEKSKVTAEGKDPKDTTNKNDRTFEISREKQRLEEQVRILKMKEALKDSFDILTDIRSKMLSNVFGMMQVGNESKPGQFVNALI